MTTISYTPPPTIREFIKFYTPGELFYDWIVGPFGSGKTTGLFFKLVHMAKLQKPGPDGIRRSRAVIVRNTAPQLSDTTITSWFYWFKPGQAGDWEVTKKNFTLRFDDVECEVLFRPLDTPQDIARVLSLEITFAIIDEFVEIPKAIVDALSGRCGRYPPEPMGGCTNWGMWGSSNPSTEDNWWYDYLHKQGQDEALPTKENGGLYLLQPPGLLDDGTGNPAAENVENLPGKTAYYVNQAKGKSEAWINQFLKARWGFSIAGTPVVPSFRSELHLKSGLLYNEHLPLLVGFDPGLGGSAFIFGQEDLEGFLNIFGELVQSGYGVSRLISEKLKPYLRRNFPLLESTDLVVAADPAAANRSSNDEKTAVEILKQHFKVSAEANNRLPLRLDAIENFTTRLIDGRPALRIDPEKCPILVRALRGGWRFKLDKKELVTGTEPEKNLYSHPGDAFGYLCRYYHRQAGRIERYGSRPRAPVNQNLRARTYHAR